MVFKRDFFFFLSSSEDNGKESNILFSTQLKPTGEKKLVWSNHNFSLLDSNPLLVGGRFFFLKKNQLIKRKKKVSVCKQHHGKITVLTIFERG